MPDSRSRALVIGDDQRLAVRIGAGHHQQQLARLLQPGSAARPPGRFMPEATGCMGVAGSMAPSQARPGAMPANSCPPFGHSTMGAATLCSNADSFATDAGRSPPGRRHSEPITANGARAACVRAISATTAALRRVAADENRRGPLMATMPPISSRRRVSAIGSPASGCPAASSKLSCGPQSRATGGFGMEAAVGGDNIRRYTRRRAESRRGWFAPGRRECRG